VVIAYHKEYEQPGMTGMLTPAPAPHNNGRQLYACF